MAVRAKTTVGASTDAFSVCAMEPKDLSHVRRIFLRHVRRRDGHAFVDRLKERLRAPRSRDVVALVVVDEKRVVRAYLVGEVRAWEFGSQPAGWIFAIGVEPKYQGEGLGRMLRQEAIRRFEALGVACVRTMVKMDDVRVQRFFRDFGFVAGPYQELELNLRPLRAKRSRTAAL